MCIRDRYEEGYHLYLTNQEPEDENLYEDTTTVYWKNGVRIRQTVPKYVRGNQEFCMKVSVENMGQIKPVRFRYELKASCLQNGDTVQVSFDEEDHKKAKYYEFEVPLRSGAVSDADASLEVREGSFRLEIDHVPVKAKGSGKSTVRIISGNVKQEIMDRYYRSAMENILNDTGRQSIYLAKISMIRAGATYVIDAVENMPFGQYLYNLSLIHI